MVLVLSVISELVILVIPPPEMLTPRLLAEPLPTVMVVSFMVTEELSLITPYVKEPAAMKTVTLLNREQSRRCCIYQPVQ